MLSTVGEPQPHLIERGFGFGFGFGLGWVGLRDEQLGFPLLALTLGSL